MSRKKQSKDKRAGDIHPFYLNDNSVVNEFINKQTNANEGLRVAIELFVNQFGNIDVSKFVPNRRDPETLENILPILEMASKIEGNGQSRVRSSERRVHDEDREHGSAPSSLSLKANTSDIKHDVNDTSKDMNHQVNEDFATSDKSEERNQGALSEEEERTVNQNNEPSLEKDNQVTKKAEQKDPLIKSKESQQEASNLNDEKEESSDDNDDMPSWMTD